MKDVMLKIIKYIFIPILIIFIFFVFGISFQKVIEIKTTINTVLETAFPSDELVTATGVFYDVVYHPKDDKERYPILVRGIVKMGIHINDLEIKIHSGKIAIFYPDIEVLSVEILNFVDFADKWTDTEFGRELFENSRLYLIKKAKQQKLEKLAEKNLKRQLDLIVREIIGEGLIEIKKKIKKHNKEVVEEKK